jgi:PhnB protein
MSDDPRNDPKTGSPEIPSGIGVLAMITVVGAAGAIDFYTRAFEAVEEYRAVGGDSGKIMHSRLAINGGFLLLNDDFPEMRGGAPAPAPAATTLHLQVDDADVWWDRAVREGATVVMPIGDQPWGDRFGMLKDPFGHAWSIASKVKKG